MNLVGTNHKLMPVIEWCPKVRYTSGKENLSWYIDQFMSTLYFLLHDSPLPLVILEMLHEMQPKSHAPLGDWFLFEDHTVIRFYGFGKRPYRLLSFLTPRIFALEYIRQKMRSDDEYFSEKR